MGHIQKRYRQLVFLTWFLTFDLILFGAFVRLTHSGLGCPDWPGCYGHMTPIGALEKIQRATEHLPYGPVSLSKAWIEMIHRYAGATLGLLIMIIVYMACRYHKELKHGPKLAITILLVVCLQGALGAWTVTHQLMPIVVTSHLLLGMALLALVTALAAREQAIQANYERDIQLKVVTTRSIRVGMGIGCTLLFIQIALGGWVSTNYAALACMDFPLCQGHWFPAMNFKEGYTLFRGLGELPSGEIISQPALTAIHWLHRNFAWVIGIVLGGIAWRLRCIPSLRGPTRLIIYLLIAQVLTGVTTIFFQWPLLIALLHSAGAAGLVLASATLLMRIF